MFNVVSENAPIEGGEIRVEFETNDRIAVTRYNNPKDIEGDVIGYISLENDIIMDVILHGVRSKDAFFNQMKKIVGQKNYRVTVEVIDSLEMIGDNCN